jgi:hypothetical protein
MAQQLVLIVVGFLLSTVLGGILGSWLQRRSWDHQNEVRLTEEERRRADEVSQRLSQLLDKRLYRMLRLYYAVYPTADKDVTEDVRERRLSDYDNTLLEWNDQINVSIALVGTYFGELGRDWIATEIYERFQEVGGRLEAAYREVEKTGSASARDNLRKDLNTLNDKVYRLNMFMMTQLREGSVGRSVGPHRELSLV